MVEDTEAWEYKVCEDDVAMCIMTETVWGKLTNEKIANIVVGSEHRSAKEVAEEILELALARHQKCSLKVEDLSVILVYFSVQKTNEDIFRSARRHKRLSQQNPTHIAKQSMRS